MRLFSICVGLLITLTTPFASAAPLKEGLIFYSGGAGDWGRVRLSLKDSVATFDPVTRQIYIVVCYLDQASEAAWSLRPTLTQADFDLANAWIDQHDDTTTSAGMLTIFAGLKELQGDYVAGIEWCNKVRDMDTGEVSAHCGAFTYVFVCDYKRMLNILLGADTSASDSVLGTASGYEAIRDLLVLSARASVLPLLDTTYTEVRQHLIQRCGWHSYTCWHYSELAALLGHQDEALKAMGYAATDLDCILYRQRHLDMLIESGQYADALTRAEGYAKDLKNETDFLSRMSECHAGLGDYGKAISGYSKHLKNHPEDYATLVRRGHAHLGKGDLKKALSDADAAIAANDSDYDAWYLKGEVAKASADPKSRDYFERSLTLSPQGTKAHARAEAALK